jgi:ubiquinone/menaquinone biosynthesis C-methylase UbiE
MESFELDKVFNLKDFDKYNGKYNNEYLLNVKYKEEADAKKDNWDKLYWGSKGEMFCRFNLAKQTIDWSRVNTWLDLGCGTGEFFKEVLETTPNQIQKIVGVDLIDSFLELSESNLVEYKVEKTFLNSSVTNLPNELENKHFDLITVSGLLQCLDIMQLPLLMKEIKNKSSVETQIWIDTLNYNYLKSFASANRRYYGVITYLEKELKDMLEHYGFNNVVVGEFKQSLKKLEENQKGKYLFCYSNNKN